MKWLLMGVLALGITGLVASAKAADDKKPEGPTGTWKWTVENNGKSRDVTLKLDVDKDSKLTGAMVGRQGAETKIEDAKYDKEKGTVTFSVTRDRNGTKTTTMYSGTLKDDTIKFTTEVDGKKSETAIEAKRVKEEKKPEKDKPAETKDK